VCARLSASLSCELYVCPRVIRHQRGTDVSSTLDVGERGNDSDQIAHRWASRGCSTACRVAHRVTFALAFSPSKATLKASTIRQPYSSDHQGYMIDVITSGPLSKCGRIKDSHLSREFSLAPALRRCIFLHSHAAAAIPNVLLKE